MKDLVKVIKLLEDLHTDNMKIISSQNQQILEKNGELGKLVNAYNLSNLRLANTISLLKIIETQYECLD